MPMTREEAISYLSQIYSTTYSERYQDALETALSALRPVNREQVEKVVNEWEPCEFCGGEAKIQISISIPKTSVVRCYCKTCGANTNWFKDINNDGSFIYKAIKAWNRRVDNA